MKKQAISFKNYQKEVNSTNITSLPKTLQEGHQFLLDAKEFYHDEPLVKETINLYLDRLNTHLSKKRDESLLGKISLIELEFIKRFLEMHRKIISREELKHYIFDLQKAILEKQITKDSQVADHLNLIQEKLIKQHNSLILKEQVRIVINRKWLRQLRKILKDPSKLDNTINGLEGHQENNGSLNLFLPINAQPIAKSKNTFRLNGALGELLGDLEKFELAITIEGDQGGGKTRFTYQLADAFAEIRNRVAIFSLEIGSRSDLITRMKEEYLQPKNQNNIYITDQLPEGYKTISKAAKDFDVIIIDSWNKTGLPSQDFDRLRKENPNTIFIVIFQRTTQKTIRGGTAPLFDAGINIEVVKVDDIFENNYAVTTKNRYGVTGIKYNIYTQKIISE